MIRRKAHERDPDILRDETAHPVERAAALSRLASDQRRAFERDIARCRRTTNRSCAAKPFALSPVAGVSATA